MAFNLFVFFNQAFLNSVSSVLADSQQHRGSLYIVDVVLTLLAMAGYLLALKSLKSGKLTGFILLTVLNVLYVFEHGYYLQVRAGGNQVYVWTVGMAFAMFLVLCARTYVTTDHPEVWDTKLLWSGCIGISLASISLFAAVVYPHITYRWGGGNPAHVVITFSKDSSLSGKKFERLLVDETEHGFYVSDGVNGQAHFIPRQSVEMIDFVASKP